MRSLLLSAVATAVMACGVARAADTYKVERWPADLDKIPCRAWSHYPDGTWALKGYIRVGSSVIDNVGFKGDTSARLLDRKCGKT